MKLDTNICRMEQRNIQSNIKHTKIGKQGISSMKKVSRKKISHYSDINSSILCFRERVRRRTMRSKDFDLERERKKKEKKKKRGRVSYDPEVKKLMSFQSISHLICGHERESNINNEPLSTPKPKIRMNNHHLFHHKKIAQQK